MNPPGEPLVTVAIATYRRARELGCALESVLAEPGDWFEVLVGDDASPDDTPAVVEKYRGDPRVREYRNAFNLGMRDNYLKLLRCARGTYIFILTDDDYLLPGALERVRRVIQAHPDVGYILSDLPTVDARTGQVVNLHRTFAEDKWVPSGFAYLPQFVRSAWVLSRQVIRREWIDWQTWEEFKDNIFFPMIVAGRMLLRAPGYYLADRLVMHAFFNPVYWEAFGRDRLEIEFNLARDAHNCMRAILHDYERTPEVLHLVENWETEGFVSYLYRPRWGLYDLVKAVGWRASMEKLRRAYPLTPPQRRALWLFPFKIPFVRAWTNLKTWTGRALPPQLVTSLRKGLRRA